MARPPDDRANVLRGPETKTPVAEEGHTLQRNRTFLRTGPDGSFDAFVSGDTGLFHRDTRFLSQLELCIAGALPNLLEAGVDDDNLALVVDLTNPELDTARGTLPADTLHVRRALTLADGALTERIDITNFGTNDVRFDLSYALAADHADTFEARGMPRRRRGDSHPPAIEDDALRLAYDGLDGIRRLTSASLNGAEVSEQGFRLPIALAPGESHSSELTISCSGAEGSPPRQTFANVFAIRLSELEALDEQAAVVTTSNALYNAWINRSLADLRMLTIQTEHGPYPAAGAPWYVTTFGRDGLITALQMLDVDPSLAAGVLRFLAAHQATEVDPASAVEPGKIVHEMRAGEMANLREHRFTRYYGSVDATPLFVMLAGAYYRRTANLDLIRAIWPNILAALDWIENYGDLDGDGFVEYRSDHDGGLIHQGWKDSHDSITHADGSDAPAPIALCEVQGYVYAAKLAAADLAAALDEPALATTLRDQAGTLQRSFNASFWNDELGSFALALDGDKRQSRVVASNAGHCLFCGIVDPALASRQVERIRQQDIWSGWGLRTLSADAARFNPLSYHNGSVWPHDTALAAAGLGRYGFAADAAQLLSDVGAAAAHTPELRLPELYCGFQREPGRGPVRYPISCTPQAWAAGSVFMLLSAILGIHIDATTRSITLAGPLFPTELEWISFEWLRVGEAVVDLFITSDEGGIDAELDHLGGPEVELNLYH